MCAGQADALVAQRAGLNQPALRWLGCRWCRSGFLPSLRDLVPILWAYPGLTSGAIVCRPLRGLGASGRGRYPHPGQRPDGESSVHTSSGGVRGANSSLRLWQHNGHRDLSTPRRDSQANPFTPPKMTGNEGVRHLPSMLREFAAGFGEEGPGFAVWFVAVACLLCGGRDGA